jgi:hypothetical protein
MSIRLKKLATKDLGPLKDISIDFTDVNLIYGKNETGKTFLVEFLIASLFKNPSFHGMRRISENGYVTLSGLSTHKELEFKPTKQARKIEDILMKENEQLPHDISKLLVVRGGELNFEDSKEGISEKVLKEYLSNEATLDSIKKGISKSIQRLEFDYGKISGANTGENKIRLQVVEKLKVVEELIGEVDNSLSGGPIQMIQNNLEINRKKLEGHEINKRKLASQIFANQREKEKTISEKQSQIMEIYAAIFQKCALLQEDKLKLEEHKNKIVNHVTQEIIFLNNSLAEEKNNIGNMVFSIQKIIENLEQKLNLFDLSRMDQIATKIRMWKEDRAKITEFQSKIEPFAEKNTKLVWLQRAIEEYQNCIGNETEKKPAKSWKNWPLTIIAISFFGVISILLIISRQPEILLIGGLFTGFLISLLMVINTIMSNKSIKNMSINLQHANTQSEMVAIRKHFSELFEVSESIVNLATLKNHRDNLKEAEIRFQSLSNEIKNLVAHSQTLENEIQECMFVWENERIIEDQWGKILENRRLEADKIDKKLVYIKTYLESLNQVENTTLSSTTYLNNSFSDLQTLIRESELKIKNLTKDLDLRKTFVDRFGDIENMPSNQLPDKLNPLSESESEIKRLQELDQVISQEIAVMVAFYADQDVEKLKSSKRNYQLEQQDFEKLRSNTFELNNEILVIEKEVNQLKIQLTELRVLQEQYIEPNPDEIVVFDELDYQYIVSLIQQLNIELANEKENLQNIKMKVVGHLSAENETWEKLLMRLNQEKGSLQKDLLEIESKIIAGICVNRVLDKFANDEREQLKSSLDMPCVISPLRKITGRYQHYQLENGSLHVKDEYDTFPLSDVSTGTREQILLSLRLGFAANLLENNHLFLVLDDAFQNSDWNRRNNSIDQMFKLAVDGWQINYFTMDDHIRDLFAKTAKNYLVEFQSISL